MSILRSFIHNGIKLQNTKCPSEDEWINKWENIHAVKSYSTIKMNEPPTNATGDEFKIMMLSKRGKAKKNTSFLCTFILVYEILGKASLIHSDIRRIMVARGCGLVIRKGYQRASWSNGKLPDVDRGGGHRIA